MLLMLLIDTKSPSKKEDNKINLMLNSFKLNFVSFIKKI